MDHISHFLKVVVAPNVFMGSPGDKGGKFKDLQIVEMNGWKHTKVFSSFLLFMTLLAYVLLGNFNNY